MRRGVCNAILAVTAWFAVVVPSLQAAIPPQERGALLALYNSTNGANWKQNSGWLGGEGSECGWYGVRCDPNQSTVVGLALGNIGLTGPIPPQIGNLTNLETLNLMANRLGGGIPSELGSLNHLKNLNLHGNQFSESIPSALGNLIHLESLDLGFNQLSGNLPSTLGNLTSLNSLALLVNQLTGSIPSTLGNLKNLVSLSLGSNQLSGSIPPELGNLIHLESLDLGLNYLSGPIPPTLGSLLNLVNLTLNSNLLNGLIPATLVNLAKLQSVHLDYNALFTTDPSLLSFLDARSPHWQDTQTIAPTHVSAIVQPDLTALIRWSPTVYQGSGRYEVHTSTRSGGPYTLAGCTPSKDFTSFLLTNLAPGTTYVVVRTVSHTPYDRLVYSEFCPEVSVVRIEPKDTLDLELNVGGAVTAATIGSEAPMQVGYAVVDANSLPASYATAVIRYRQDGVTVSEVGIPAAAPTTAARLFVDYRSGAAFPGSTVRLDVSTGLAVVNRGDGPATITATLRNSDGQVLAGGTGSLAKNAHWARFVWELGNVLPGFVIPTTFPTATGYGTLELASNQPLSVLALRIKGDYLSNMPIVDLTQPPTSAPAYLPQLADGGGYATTVILMNRSASQAIGTLNLYAQDGAPLTVRLWNGPSGSSFNYSIPPRGAVVLQTDGSSPGISVGWIAVSPASGTPTPKACGFFQYDPAGHLVSESEIPSASPTTHARLFIDMSPGRQTGVALVNPGASSLNLTMTALEMNGSPVAGTSPANLSLTGKGHMTAFVYQRISGLPAGFRGVLDIAGASPFVPLTSRALVNERGNFLLTAFPAVDMNQLPPVPAIFPQVVAGGGYQTEFILLSMGPSGAPRIAFFGDAGNPLAIGK